MLDISIIITALPKIHHGLGFSATGLAWVQNAYALTFGGLLLLGRAGDILGRRRMFVAGIALFTVASLAVGGLAQSPAWPIDARALQGVGASQDHRAGRSVPRAPGANDGSLRSAWFRGADCPTPRGNVPLSLAGAARAASTERIARYDRNARAVVIPRARGAGP